MSFLEFTNVIKGFTFSLKGQQVYSYQLYWSKIDPYKLVCGLTEYKMHTREDKKPIN